MATDSAKITGGSPTRSRYAQQLATATWREAEAEAEAERIFYAYLRRGLDPSGRAHLAERIRTGTKLTTIRASVLGSSEHFREIAASGNARYHRDLLGREPTTAELATWRTRVRDQATGERDLQVSLVGSAAYRTRHA